MSSTRSRRTPYNDVYPSCERVCAQLVIYPGAMDPEEVTQRLDIQPTEVNRAGEVARNSLGRERCVKLNGWFLSSEGKSDSRDLRRHLDWLIELLMPRRAPLLVLQEVEGLKIGINCIWWSAGGQGGPTLWPEQMRAIAELDLECSFDIGFFGQQDDGN